jgi:hypothetical protein
MRDAPDRFWAKVSPEPNTGCWLWTGALSGSRKYGSFYYDGRMQKAHRVAYQIFVGPVPDGLDLDHLCRVPSCCNPDHLEPVTRSENLRRSPDMDRNSNKTHCCRGHKFTAVNTIWRTQGWRGCRACMNMHMRNWRERNASAA